MELKNEFDDELYVRFVRESSNDRKLRHAQSVVETAKRLIEHYQIDHPDRLLLAALLHDNARCLPENEQKQLAERYPEPLTPFEAKNNYYHAQAGAQQLIEKFAEFDACDPVVQLVAFHPSGKAPLTRELGTLMVADWAEPNRPGHKPQYLREHIGEVDLDELVRVYYETMTDVTAEHRPDDHYRRSDEAYDYLKTEGLL